MSRTLARVLLALAAWAIAVPGLAASYTFRSDSFAWETAANTITWNKTCTGYASDDDEAAINFSGGFTFTFGATAYSSVRVLSNGSLQFGTDTGFFRTYTNTTLPAGAASAYSGSCPGSATTQTMMAYWTDLNPGAAGSGGVTWEQKGSAPNRYVVVSWNSVYQYNTSTPYSFQVILYENGEFKYQYGNANASGSNATIGVQVSATDYTLYAFNSGYNANGTAIRWVAASTNPTRVAEYRFDEFSYSGKVGEVADSSGNGHAGVRVGSATSSATGYVCRGVDVPANTTTTTSGVDTQLSLVSGVGSTGSVDFWFRSNVVWTSATAAMLVDATTTNGKAFYLMRSGGGALRFVASDASGGSVVATTAAQSFAAGAWTHVAATWRLASGSNQSVLRLYVNGVLATSASGTTTGALDPALGALLIGDNRSTNTPTGATANSANGQIDEFRVYNYEITTADIAVDMAATHTCPLPLDHYELSLPSTSLACLPSTVTVTACADTSSPCTNAATSLSGQTATLATSAGTLAAVSVAFNASGVATTTLSHPAASNGSAVTVTLSGEQTTATNARQCCPNGSTCSASNSCATTFSTAGFIVAAAVNAAATTVPAQTAGTGSATYYLRAVQTNTTTKACDAALAGTTTVNWAAQCNNPTTCSSGNLMTLTGNSATAIASNPSSGVSSTTAVSMNFDANGNAPFSFNYADVGQVTLWASKSVNSAPLAGSSNAFVVKPAGFALTSIQQTASPNLANPAAAAAAGAKFAMAGESFSATVTARTSSGASAPNFGRETVAEGVLLTPALVLPPGGATGTLSNGTVAGTSFGAGIATVSNLAFSEVGIITLTPSAASGSYLGAGAVSGTASGNIGRFVPAKFAVSAGSVTNRSALGCSPVSTFSYLGENFTLGLMLTAQNVAGGTTANYAGSFAKFDPTVAANWKLAGLGGSTSFSTSSGRLALGSSTGSWASGVMAGATITANAPRAATPDGPFAVGFGIAPVDSDGIAMAAYDLATTSGGAQDHASVASMNLRFGRLRLSNQIGAADRVLKMPVVGQYWTGTVFDVNTLDSCTSVPTSVMSFGNLRRTLTTADTRATAAVALVAGVGSLSMAVPGGGRSGTFDVAFSLGSSATDASCLQPWTPGAGDAATAGANLAYLRGAWCGNTYDKDPSARASFGLQRTQDFQVYRRENY